VRLQPIVYTTDMGAAADWYARVLGVEPAYASDMWTAFPVGDAILGVHLVEEMAEGSRVELSLVATEPLEAVVSRLEGSGVSVQRGIQTRPSAARSCSGTPPATRCR